MCDKSYCHNKAVFWFYFIFLWQVVVLSVLREIWVPPSFLTVITKLLKSVVPLNHKGTGISHPWETHHPRPFLSVILVLVHTSSTGIATTRVGLNCYLEITLHFFKTSSHLSLCLRLLQKYRYIAEKQHLASSLY